MAPISETFTLSYATRLPDAEFVIRKRHFEHFPTRHPIPRTNPVKNLFYLAPFLLLSGCINFISLPSETDAGPVSGQDAGPTEQFDGGPIVSTVPLIKSLAPLAPAKCGKAMEKLEPLRPTCAPWSACAAWVTQGAAAVPFDLLDVMKTLSFVKFVSPSGTAKGVLLQGTTSYYYSLFLVQPSGIPELVENEPLDSQGFFGVAQGSAVYHPTGPSLWHIRSETDSSFELRMRAPPGDLSARGSLLSALPVTSSIVGAAVRVDHSEPQFKERYLYADESTLYEVYPSDTAVGLQYLERAVFTLPSSQRLATFVIEGDDLFYKECPRQSKGPCTVKRYQWGSQVTTTLIDEQSKLIAGPGLVILENDVYALDPRSLVRVPRTGGVVQTVYAGEAFPQYDGTLRGSSLEAIDGKLYLGQVCEFDADAPTYAAVELDLQYLTARYLEEDPNYPFVPKLEGYIQDRLNEIAQAQNGGLFLMGK